MLVSSHLLTEVAQTVDEVVVLSGGRLVTQTKLIRHDEDLESLFFDLVNRKNQETAS